MTTLTQQPQTPTVKVNSIMGTVQRLSDSISFNDDEYPDTIVSLSRRLYGDHILNSGLEVSPSSFLYALSMCSYVFVEVDIIEATVLYNYFMQG